MNNGETSYLTRRSVLVRGGAMALGSFAATSLRPWAMAAEGSDDRRNFGPKLGPDSRKMIAEQLMKPAHLRKITDQILGTSHLENVFYLDLGKHAVLIDTGFDYQVD